MCENVEWLDYIKQPAHIKTSSICAFAGKAFIDEVPFVLGFIQMGEAKTVMSSVVKLSEDPAENARMLNRLMKERRHLELNGLKVEPRFAEKPLYTVRDLWFQVVDKILRLNERETETTRILNHSPLGSLGVR